MLINYGSCVVCFNQNSTNLYTLTVTATPSTANISLTAPGYTQIDNSIRVPENTVVECEVYNQGYVPYTENITVTQPSQSKSVTLTQGVLYTINPTPADATVEFTINGYTYPINAIEVPIGSPFSYKVSKEDYAPVRNTVTVTTPTTVNVQLEPLSTYDLEDYDYQLDEDMNATLINYTGSSSNPTVP